MQKGLPKADSVKIKARRPRRFEGLAERLVKKEMRRVAEIAWRKGD